MEIGVNLKETADRITVALDQLIPPADGPEADLMRAMRHAALANGQRLRPFIVLQVGEMFGADPTALLRTAAAVECVHTSSLVHADLPFVFNESYRRGQPTAHKAFDMATAVLAGDALLSLAFGILSDPDTHADGTIRAELTCGLARAVGAKGMLAGQMIDLLGEDFERDFNTITRLQRMKTGALITYSVEAGAVLGKAREDERHALTGFAHDLALALHISLELERHSTAPTDGGEEGFVFLLGADGARQRVRLLATQAKEHLSIFRNRAENLLQSVDYLVQRGH